MGNRFAVRASARSLIWLLVTALVASTILYVTAPDADALSGDTGPARIPGSNTSGLRSHDFQWDTKNQHRIWYNEAAGRWDAIIPTGTNAAWRIAQGVIPATGATPRPGAVDAVGPVLGPTVATASRGRPDAFWDEANDRLYVLMSGGGATTLTVYNFNGSNYVVDASVGGSLPTQMNAGDSRGVIHKSSANTLWAAVMNDNGLFVTRSTNDGLTWEPPANLIIPVGEGQVQLTDFDNGGKFIAVAAAEDGQEENDGGRFSQYLFYRIPESDPIAVTRAVGSITFAAVPAVNEQVAIAGRTYTFVDTVGTTAGQVARGATPEAARANLVNAVNGGSGAGTAYSTSTLPHGHVTASGSGATANFTAKQAGPSGNSLALTSTGAHTISGFTGGTGSWVREGIEIPQGNDANQGAAVVHADDEMSLVRDNNHNIYLATETQRTVRAGASNGTAGITTSPQVIVYKRTPAGAWTTHVVKNDQQSSNQDRKRPVVAIMDSTLYVFAIHQNQIDTSYWSAPLGSMNFSGPTPLIDVPHERFRNNSVPRFPTTSARKLPVLIDWAGDGNPDDDFPPVQAQERTIWQATLPATGNQPPGVFAGLNKVVARGTPVNLDGLVQNGSQDAHTGQTPRWTKVSGPGAATNPSFSSPTSPTSTATFNTNGTYVLRLTVTENGTHPLVNYDDVTITVQNANRPPTLSISNPDNGDVFEQGRDILFSATASDPDVGNISGDIRWTSNRDGLIGVGGSFFKSDLSLGTHTITARVTDGQNSVTRSVNITVIKPGTTPPPGGGGGGGGGTPDNPFIDDNGSVFEDDIEWLAGRGITRGCNPPVNDRFCPDDFVTRGQMAAFLVRAFGYTDDGGGDLFRDDNGSVFEGDIDRLGTAGVTRGCNPPTNDRFCPNDFVTRGQMAAFLHRALGD